MKVKYVLVAILVATLALGGVGCSKVTGGGQFEDFNAGKVTFGFNAQPTEPYNPEEDELKEIGAKGQFHLVAHGTKTRIKGNFTGTWVMTDPEFTRFFGTCTINGTGEYDFNVQFADSGEQGPNKGDGIIVHIGSTNPFGPVILMYSGDLEAGNIQVHKAKKK